MNSLLIKNTELGIEKVFPKNYILNLIDKDSGKNLQLILNSFNMLFLSYAGNKAETRKQVPLSLRKLGLWITYVIGKTVVIEWYNSNAIDDNTWGSSTYWMLGSNMLVGDISISSQGTWVVNGEDTGISPKGDKGDSPLIRIYNNKILVSYDKGVTYLDLNNTPVYTKFRFNSLNNTYLVSYDLGTTWEDISDEKVYHKFKYNLVTNTYQESLDFGKTWSNISAEKVYTKFKFNRNTNTYQVSTDLGLNWTDVSSDKVYYLFRYNGETNTHLVSTDFGNTWTNVSEDKVFYLFRTNDNRLLVSTDLGITWENCSEPIAAWFRWAEVSGTGNIGKILISRDLQNWSDLSPIMTNNLYIKGYVATVGNLPSDATIGDIYMVGPTYDESDVAQDYPHYRMWVKQSSGWIDNGEFTSIETVSSYQDTNPSTIKSAKTHVITHEGNTIKPMTDFNSVFDADGKPLTDRLTELESEVDDVGYIKKDIYNLFKKGNSYINSTGKIITFQNYSIFFFKVNSGDKIHLKYVGNPSSKFSIVAFTNTIDDIADDKQFDVIWGGKSSYEDTVYNVQEDGFIATVGWQRDSEYYVKLKKMQSDESGIEEVKNILFNSIDGGNMLALDKVSSLYIDGVSGKFTSSPNYSIYYTTVKKGEVLHVEYKNTPAIEFGLFGFVDNIDDIVAGNYANCIWKEKTSYTALDYVVEKDCVLVFVGSNLKSNEYIEISKKDNKSLIELVNSLRTGNRVPFRSYNYKKNMFVNNLAEVVSYSGYSIYIYGVNSGDQVELKFNKTPDRGFCLVGFVDNINKVVSGSSIDEKIWSGSNSYEDTRVLIKKDGFLLVCSKVQSDRNMYVTANRVSDIKQYVSKTNNRTIVNILKNDDAITIYNKMYNAFLEENCDVIFENGEYDVSLMYDYIVNTIKETWTVGLPIGGGCRYFFNGSTLKATRPIGYDGDMNILDTQACSSDLEINDVTLINNGGTYCIHDECNADERHSIHTYNNVICNKDSNIAFGCGTGFNGIIKMNNCVFTTGNSAHAILIHSVIESKNPSNIPIDFKLFMNGCYVNTKIRFTTFVKDRDKSFVMLNNNYFGTENEGENLITELKKFNNVEA